jgi:hypothetical protein
LDVLDNVNRESKDSKGNEIRNYSNNSKARIMAITSPHATAGKYAKPPKKGMSDAVK